MASDAADDAGSLGRGLVGSWRLAGDGRDWSRFGRPAIAAGHAAFGPSLDRAVSRPIARPGGSGGWFEVAGLVPDGREFSLAAWVNIPSATRSSIGDIAASFDPEYRSGFSLGVNHSSPCGNHGNDRNLFFGVDAATEPAWTDWGQPSPSTIMVCALAVHDAELYAATWEAGASDIGHVYRLDGDTWRDCGSPGAANAVTRLAVHGGRLFAGVSRLKGGGSGMPDSRNVTPGGRVFRYEGGHEWSDTGGLDGGDSISGLVPFDDELFAIPMYSESMFRMTPTGWVSCGSPGRRLLALGAHGGAFYGAGNDHADVVSAIAQTAAGKVVAARSSEGGGGMFRYDGGTAWTSLGLQPETTQVYSIETYDNALHIGTWPNGIVFRLGPAGWECRGRVGTETEVMNLLAYNGMLYAGTLPGAEVHRLDPGRWTRVGMLDRTPAVRYRRVASMVVFKGELYCGTLPAGQVRSLRAGWVASSDSALGTGWHHVAAVCNGGSLELSVDGQVAGRCAMGSESRGFQPRAQVGLTLGGGPRGGFEGELADVRLYDIALGDREVRALAAQRPS